MLFNTISKCGKGPHFVFLKAVATHGLEAETDWSARANVGARVKCNWPFQKKLSVRFSPVHTGSKNNMEGHLCLLCILDYAPRFSFIIQCSISCYGMHALSSALRIFNLIMPIWFTGEFVSLQWAVSAAINTPLWTAPFNSDTSTHSGASLMSEGKCSQVQPCSLVAECYLLCMLELRHWCLQGFPCPTTAWYTLR